MIELSGEKAELRFTIDIIRAETGLKETVELVGIIENNLNLEQEKENVSNT